MRGIRSTTRWRVVAAMAAATLAASSAAAPPAHAAPIQAGPVQAGPVQAGPARVASRPVTAKAPDEIPCPKPNVKPPAGRPPRPTPPPDDPAQRAVGGDALATSGLVTPSGSPKPPAVTATSWLVADLDSGEVLGGCGPHVYGTPASVQKLLLAATAMTKLSPKATTTITQGDVTIEAGSSAVGLVKGGKYNVATLWTGLLLNSGNDAANTLARMAGGKAGVAGTVAAMNAEAQRLGAYQTHAVTPSGLDGPGQFTSAYDLALIARVNFDRPDFVKYALTKTFQMPAQKAQKKGGFQIQNENKLIFGYKGALGGKTGFTTIARHSYVGGAEQNGRRLVVTLLGAEASPLRGYQQGEALLDWGFALPKDASVGKLVDPEAPGTSRDESAAAPPDDKRGTTTPTAARQAPRGVLTLGAAAAVAIVLAATPLLLLLTQRRRRRVRRRPTRTQPTYR